MGRDPIREVGSRAIGSMGRDDIPISVQLGVNGDGLSFRHGHLDLVSDSNLHGALGQLAVEMKRVKWSLTSRIGIG